MTQSKHFQLLWRFFSFSLKIETKKLNLCDKKKLQKTKTHKILLKCTFSSLVHGSAKKKLNMILEKLKRNILKILRKNKQKKIKKCIQSALICIRAMEDFFGCSLRMNENLR